MTGITEASFGGRAFPAEVVQRIIACIVGGAPISATWTRINTTRGSVVFPVVEEVAGAEWVPELGLIPSLTLDDDSLAVAVSKLAGTILLSRETVADASFPITQQVEQIIRDSFSAKLDADLVAGTGPAPAPTGVLSVAPEVTGVDWELAAIAAKASIGTAGGHATHIAANPAVLGDIESARDSTGRALYSDAGTTFAGLETVAAPAATVPLVYDQSRMFTIVRSDFTADISDTAEGAWSHYGVSLRLVGRFAAACPCPDQAIRKLALTTGGGSSEPTAAPAQAPVRRAREAGGAI